MIRIQVVTTARHAGEFTFSQTNLFSTPAAIRSAGAGRPAPRDPEAIAVTDPHADVTVTVLPPPHTRVAAATCTDAHRTRTGNPASFGALSDHTLSLAAAHAVPGADITCVFSAEVRGGVHGWLFTDDGAGGGIANDGIVNGAEAGWAGGAVALTNCAGLRHQVATAGPDGRFVLALPPGLSRGAALCVQSERAAGRQPTGASVEATALRTRDAVTVSGVAYRYASQPAVEQVSWGWAGAHAPEGVSIALGSVPAARFGDAGARAGQAGRTAVHAHMLTAGTAASVSFSIPRAFAEPATGGWAERIFADPLCTGLLQPGADRLFPPASPRTLRAGERLCIVLQETIPATAPPGSRNTTRVQATLDYANARPGLSESVFLDDITTVLEPPAPDEAGPGAASPPPY